MPRENNRWATSLAKDSKKITVRNLTNRKGSNLAGRREATGKAGKLNLQQNKGSRRTAGFFIGELSTLHKTYILDTSSVIFTVIITILVTAAIVYILTARFKTVSGKNPFPKDVDSTISMQLQAYERLIILVDRIALPNVITRVNQPTSSSREMQLMLTQSIRSEFDYNITQQIYVSSEAWNAVKNLKEQNLLIINQLANVLPPNATGLDLNKLLLEFLMNDKKGSLHEVVSEVLSYEAKKMMEW